MPNGTTAARTTRTAARLVGALAGAVWVLVGVSGVAEAAQSDDPEAPVAVAARVADADGMAKLTFDLSAPVEGRAFALADPERIIIDIPEVNFQIDPSIGRAGQGKALDALIRSFRFGTLSPGKSRIVIDLTGPARVEKLSTTAVATDALASRLEIDLKPCEPAVFQQFVKEAAPQSVASPNSPAVEGTTEAGQPVIVLDPGHGGVDGGAYGPPGVVEKAIVFDFSRELAEKLQAKRRYKVILTRNGDDFVSLADRVRIAEDAQASLFVSIHADTLADAADVSGATVYTLADRASDAEAARVAEHENAADKAAGVEPSPEAAGVTDILFDLKRRETRLYTHMFSRNVVSEWRAAGRLNRNPERSAHFVVLKAPDFPSVLLELGYLSNPQDVKALTSADWRDKATSALAAAIDRFFTSQPADGQKPQANVGTTGSPAAPPQDKGSP
ncbi:MAG TPA: N-acetylmuramoyl-L-alanine amidase [Roseiarcus sp.]|nr:N-acetylmuramoyl-L-alanine amidase [Roseiarcus sp.]